jgi:hypothetical protein
MLERKVVPLEIVQYRGFNIWQHCMSSFLDYSSTNCKCHEANMLQKNKLYKYNSLYTSKEFEISELHGKAGALSTLMYYCMPMMYIRQEV